MGETEEVLGILLAAELGRFPVVHRTLIFTANRIIVAKQGITKELVGFLAGGVVGTWLAFRSEKKHARQTIEQKSVEKVLKADEKNYEILYSEVSKANLKRVFWLFVIWTWPYLTKVILIAKNKQYRFKLKGVKFRDAIELFQRVLPYKTTVA